MADSASRLPAHPSLEQLQKQAKELLRRHRAGETVLLEGLHAINPRSRSSAPSGKATLADAQLIIAREHGFESWADLKHYLQALPLLSIRQYEQIARDLAVAHTSGNIRAVREFNRVHSMGFVDDFHDPLTLQQRLTTWFASENKTADLAVADARQMIAHSYGFPNWQEFAARVTPSPSYQRSAPDVRNSPSILYRIDWKQNRLTSCGPQSQDGWRAIFAVMKEHGISALKADGISDAAIKQLARLDHVTHLSMTSDALTDEGLLHLAQMPQLLDLEIGGANITDVGLACVRHLAELRRFQSCWTQRISDAGAANLAFCRRLESVDLMGTATGDGLIHVLAGNASLRRLKTGRCVTDAGLKLLHQIPAFKTWLGGEIQYGLMSAEAQPTHLLLDGPFTDSGFADLVGLEGLFGLSLFWHSSAFTSSGLAALRLMPKLGLFGCQGAHCDDQAMSEIAAMPQLRMLMGQGAVATDKGWRALSRSTSLEYIWGHECPNLTGRGFAALAAMPSLRGIGVSCRNVDDASLALLPTFPALREMMPMDVSDSGFRHVGLCQNLESLWCMYCRDTGDLATEQLAHLPKLKTYYAGMTQITDRSLKILSGMQSLERTEFWGCQGITDKGVGLLAALPQLREIQINGSPNVSPKVTTQFPTHVDVKYSA